MTRRHTDREWQVSERTNGRGDRQNPRKVQPLDMRKKGLTLPEETAKKL